MNAFKALESALEVNLAALKLINESNNEDKFILMVKVLKELEFLCKETLPYFEERIGIGN